MLPKHGKIECRLCFSPAESKVRRVNADWMMINDPGAWGGDSGPDYLVLGFSKGSTQADLYDSASFEGVAFAGMRPRLTAALQAMGVLASYETVDQKVGDPNSNIAFGSLIRCSVSRFDKVASAKAGRPVYGCTGPLIAKSFKEIPEVIGTCASRFLTRLPASVRVVFMLGNSDGYVAGCQALLRKLFPDDFVRINAMAVFANGRIWAHLAHPSGLNGHFNDWLNAEVGAGHKRQLAKAAVDHVMRGSAQSHA